MAKSQKKELAVLEPRTEDLEQFNDNAAVDVGVKKVREIVKSVIDAGISMEIVEGRTKLIENFVRQSEAKLDEIQLALDDLFKQAEQAINPAQLSIRLVMIAAQKMRYIEWVIAAVSVGGEKEADREHITEEISSMFDENIARIRAKTFRKAS